MGATAEHRVLGTFAQNAFVVVIAEVTARSHRTDQRACNCDLQIRRVLGRFECCDRVWILFGKWPQENTTPVRCERQGSHDLHQIHRANVPLFDRAACCEH